MTGIVIGYNSTGSSTSRLRARTSIAANSVPTAAKPSVPAASSPTSSSGCVEQRRLEQQRDQRHEHDLDRRRAAAGCRAACRRRAPDDRPAPAAARAAFRSAARVRTSGRAPASRKTRSRSTGCRRPRPRPGAPPRRTPNANTSTHDSAKNSVVNRISRLRTSTVKSFRITSQADAQEPPHASDSARPAAPAIALAQRSAPVAQPTQPSIAQDRRAIEHAVDQTRDRAWPASTMQPGAPRALASARTSAAVDAWSSPVNGSSSSRAAARAAARAPAPAAGACRARTPDRIVRAVDRARRERSAARRAVRTSRRRRRAARRSAGSPRAVSSG